MSLQYKFFETAADLENRGISFVVVTLLSTRGHAPQDAGAKIIVTAEGLYFGTVGGGKVEAKCIEEAKKILCLSRDQNKIQTVNWNLQRDVGMSCGGEVTFLFERKELVSWSVVIFGAGHVCQALARALAPLSCQVFFVDSRSEWLEKLPQKRHNIKIIQLENPADYVQNLKGDEYCYSITRGHAFDIVILNALFSREKVIGKKFPYIGAIGSKVKAIKLRQELKQFQEDEKTAIKNFHCPIGLPLGNNDPAEIAISVIAELIQVRDQKLLLKPEND